MHQMQQLILSLAARVNISLSHRTICLYTYAQPLSWQSPCPVGVSTHRLVLFLQTRPGSRLAIPQEAATYIISRRLCAYISSSHLYTCSWNTNKDVWETCYCVGVRHRCVSSVSLPTSLCYPVNTGWIKYMYLTHWQVVAPLICNASCWLQISCTPLTLIV